MSEPSSTLQITPQKRRSRPGRSSRRRQRKAQAILEAAQARVGDAAAISSTPASLPSDRGYTLEGVMVRRREERKRRNNNILHRHHLTTKDIDGLLDPKDECALQSQLGFIPGNAICVAARHSKELDALVEEQQQPSVLKLYPMAVRESYRGGRSDGRAFKGRRRGAMRVEECKEQNDTDTGSATHDVNEAQSSGNGRENRKDRAWLVESPRTAKSDQSNEEVVSTNDTVHNNNNERNNHRQEEEEEAQTPRRIIEPFPTLYWLTSPTLRCAISKLEISKDHNVAKMEERLRSSPDHLRQMERAHKSYGRQRWEILTDEDKANIIQRGWKSSLDETRGVAGIYLKEGRYDCVKCLHAHAAHYLAQVAEWMDGGGGEGQDCDRDDLNLVGKWTMEARRAEQMKISIKPNRYNHPPITHMNSTYGGLDTASPQKGDKGGGEEEEEEWLHVHGAARRTSSPTNNDNNNEFAIDDDDDHNEETQSLASSNKIQALEMGDADEDSECGDLHSDDEEEYDLTDHTPSLSQHLSGRTTLLAWRPREQLRCITLILVTLVLAAIFAYVERSDVPRLGHPPGAVGVGHAAYDSVHSSWLEEYEARLTLYRHRATGAEFLAYVPDATRTGPNYDSDNGGYDPKPDKVFGVAFRTKPESSTGVPHILEHSVLCGSRKYPSRDPFAHLLKGSLQTFLNAFTYPDRTVYPVASRNRADFHNLMDVYLDAVFHPRAVEDEGWWVLRQEGWRYDVVDADSNEEEGGGRNLDGNRVDFEYKGVVFSEMKGAYSDPEDLLERTTQSLLFPDNPYHFDSGGDPAIIPTLTREEFVAFYKKYYHPTNARLFVAGDESDVYYALSTADRYMAPMGYNSESRKDSIINYQPRQFKKPHRERKPFAVAASEEGEDDGESSEGYMLCITWLLNTQPLTPRDELAWIVLDSLLLGKPSSPLQKALEDSNLGEETIGGGLDDELLQSTFAIGMKGLKKREDVHVLEDLILSTLEKLDSDGFSEDEIAASMNTIEFRLREGGGGLRGLEIFLGALTKWNYDLSPKDALVYEDALTSLKEEIDLTGSNIFQQLIRDSLLSNNHRVVLEMYPSSTLEADQLQDAKMQLFRAQSGMSDTEYQSVIDEGIKLKKLQDTEETPEVISTNPSLSIADIDPTPIEYPIHVEKNAFKSGIQLITHEVASSGIAYVDLGLDISMVPYEDIILLPSLISLLNEAGTKEMSDAEFRNYIGKVTGGVYASLDIMSVKPTGWDDEAKVLPGVNMLTMLFLRGKCTIDKIPDLFNVFEKVLMDINLDDSQDILRNALKSSLSSKKSSVASRGHSFANRRIRGRYSARSFVDEKMYGVSSLEAYATVLEAVEADWGQFVLRLKKLREAILNGNRNGMLLNLTGDGSVLQSIMEEAEEFLTNGLPVDLGNPAPPTPDFRSVDHPWISSAKDEMQTSNPIRDEGIVVSTQVAYVGEGGRLYDVGEQVSGDTSVVSHYLTTGYMWDVIRAKNGAYGAYSSFSSSDGIATLYTYRDPNEPEKTLDAFHAAADDILQAAKSSLTRDQNAAITTAIVGTIGDLDGSALSAKDAGWVALLRYLRGESALSRQRWRKGVLDSSVDDFVDYAERLKSWRTPSIAIVASQSAFNQMDRELTLFKAQ